jgi:hypothetical protein
MLGDPRETFEGAIDAFNSDPPTALAETTLTDLLAVWPENVRIEHVYVKVIAINTLYHARVLDKDLHLISEYIAGLNLDRKLKDGSPEAVDLIYRCTITSLHYFSFATKFCSWHNQMAYSMYDGNVYEALCAYRKQDKRFKFSDRDFANYAGFLAVIRRFMSAYDLDNRSLKDVDKFLWIVGGRVLAAKPKRGRAKSRL